MPTSGDFVQRHAEAISTKHKITVVHVVSDNSLQSRIKVDITVQNNVKIIIGYVPDFKNPFSKYYYFTKAYKQCLKEVGLFDMIHLNVSYPKGIVALYLKWFKKKPFIITEHWTGYQASRNISIGYFRTLITKIIIRNSSFICPVSKNLQLEMSALGFKGNYKPIPNVVNTGIFKNPTKTDKSFTITHISHMGNEHKNIIGILNVISRVQKSISNLELNLIGEDSIKYEGLIQDLKITNVNIIDQIPNIEVANYLKKSNVFVLFSNYENLPCVILESFACGVPVISTNIGGISEYFPENYGYLINKNDEQALENSILKIYNSELIFDKIEMQQYAEKNFSIDSICNKFSELYYKSLNN